MIAPGHAIEVLLITLSMRMRVIPVQSGRLIRSAYPQCSATIHPAWQSSSETIIPRCIGRYMQTTMKMKVRHAFMQGPSTQTSEELLDIWLMYSNHIAPPGAHTYYWRNFTAFKDKRSLTSCRIVDGFKFD